ncbi:MAG: adenylate/guanylate cyclase domain-containing protein [bacterium]
MESSNAAPLFYQASMSNKNICKLSAVMFTDIKGFSRRMGESEHLTLKLLRDHNRITRFLMRKHNGRIIKSTGDGYLIDFDSAVVAVQCAVEAQQRFQRYNEGKPESDQIFIRIGISLGEVMIVDGDLFGDEVNIAARVQTLAEPGGICITKEVYERVKSKLAIVTVNMGPQDLKNIRQKIDIYKVCLKEPGQAAIEVSTATPAQNANLMAPVATAPVPASASENNGRVPVAPALPAFAVEKVKTSPKRTRVRHMVPVLSFAVILAALLSWKGFSDRALSWLGEASYPQATQAGFMTYGKIPGAAAKKAIAVAYFENRTQDEKDNWLCTGLADMIITDLRQNTSYHLLGRTKLNEALAALGKKNSASLSLETAQAVALKTKADYMICGAIARQHELLRIDVQLFEAHTGELLAAEKIQGENVLLMVQSLTERLQRRLGQVARL